MNLRRRIIVITVLGLIFIGLKITSHYTQQKFFADIKECNFEKVLFPAKITKIIDGNTMEVVFLKDKPDDFEKKEVITLIGIRCPSLNLYSNKMAEPYAKESVLFVKQELENQYVQIQLDNVSGTKDKNGRVLSYVWLDNFLFNKILLERGYASFSTSHKFNASNMILFQKAEEYSKLNRLGIWK